MRKIVHNFDHLKDLAPVFGNRTRVRLIFTFVNDVKSQFSISNLVKLTHETEGMIRRELSVLESAGLVVSFHGKDKKKYYQLKSDFIGIEELRSLFNRKLLNQQDSLRTSFRRMPKLFLLILTGRFVGLNDGLVDVLIVGDLSIQQIKNITKSLEDLLGSELNFVHFTNSDFHYRYSVADQFIFRILDNKHNIVVDRFKLDNRPRVIK